jgi:hypothetical protein
MILVVVRAMAMQGWKSLQKLWVTVCRTVWKCGATGAEQQATSMRAATAMFSDTMTMKQQQQQQEDLTATADISQPTNCVILYSGWTMTGHGFFFSFPFLSLLLQYSRTDFPLPISFVCLFSGSGWMALDVRTGISKRQGKKAFPGVRCFLLF